MIKPKYTWLTKIPTGSHGSTPTQKRYWKVVSDNVRIADWYKYKKCIACGKYIHNWKDLQAGHFKSWAVCRGYSKWSKINIFGECAYCNTGFNGNEVGVNFKDGIIKRYGDKRMKEIEALSSHPSEKMEDHIIVEKIRLELEEMRKLPEQPDYFTKVINDKTYDK